jgi:hypothetical protein
MNEILEVSNWDDYLEKLNPSQKDYYYSMEYYEVFKEKYPSSEIKAFIFTKGDKILIYPCYKIKVAGYDLDSSYYFLEGCYGYNGYITNSNDELFFQEFNDKFTIICNELNIICEFTRFSPFLDNSKLYSKECVYHDRKTVLLDLNQGYQSIWDNEYHSKNRNVIRKGYNSGHNLVIDNSRYIEFKQIYDATMVALKSEKFYFFSESFFKKLSNSSNIEFLFVANSEDKIERGLILIYNKYYAHYFLSGRSSKKDNSLNNLLLDFAVKRSIELGCSLFHFGGGSSDDLNDSLFKYKKKFAKTLKSFDIGFKIHNQKIYDLITESWDNENDNNNKRFLRFKE